MMIGSSVSSSPPKLGGVPGWAGWSEGAPDIPLFRPPLTPPNSGGEASGRILPLSSCVPPVASGKPSGGSQRGSEEPIVINSGYRSPELNKKVGGSATSNHLTGCTVDIRVYGIEQAMRYAVILMDYADETKQDYDELLIERNRSGGYWLHFAVRPKDNRRKTMVMQL